MSISNFIHLLVSQAKEIRKQRGTIGLLKKSIQFLYRPVFRHETYFLYTRPLLPEYEEAEALPRISESKLTFKVVTSNAEADQLEKAGYSFRTYPTYFNYDRKIYTRWLDCGVFAFCTFVEKDFAAINWVVMSQNSQDLIKSPPVKVDYARHIAFPRGAWVNPKYRGLELYRYTLHNRDRYLQNKGITSLQVIILITNKTGEGLVEATGCTKYGQAEFRKFLWRTQWQESSDCKSPTPDKNLS
jgi:hypothetical protein